SDAQRKKRLFQRKAAVTGERTDPDKPPNSELERARDLEDAAWDAFVGMEHILEHAPKDIDYARELATNIDLYQQIDDLVTAAQARLSDIIEQFECYREGLGALLKKASQQIVDVACQEVDPVILAIMDRVEEERAARAEAARLRNGEKDVASIAPSI